jgi:hypothetical protein
LRKYRDSATRRDAKFSELAADLAATIHGIAKEDLLSQEVRQQRRALSLAWSVATLLLVATGTAASQWSSAVKSERFAAAEAARAERNFGAAKNTIDGVVIDLTQGFKDVEGLRADTVQRILGRAEAAVSRLASRIQNDPDVRDSEAVMFGLFSETYLRLGDSQLAANNKAPRHSDAGGW